MMSILNPTQYLDDTSIDELIDLRAKAREEKNFRLSDEIRNYLDLQLVFIFDGVNGQEIYHLTESYFKFKNRIEEQKKIKMTNRKFVEYKIKQNINSEAYFQDWLIRNK